MSTSIKAPAPAVTFSTLRAAYEMAVANAADNNTTVRGEWVACVRAQISYERGQAQKRANVRKAAS